MSDAHLLETMIGAALAAGRVIQQIYEEGFEVQRKADASPVTRADHAAESVILQHLAGAAPQLPIVAEEEAAAGRIPALGSEFFLVDPLDGTKEFIERRGDFTVNIALVRAGAPVLGVVYAPARGKLYAGDTTARRAFRAAVGSFGQAPERLAIHVRPLPATGLAAVASRSHRTPETDAYLSRYRVAELVSVGSSLKFCLVAEGEADLYPRLGRTMEWDTAAGHAVLVAAGGRVDAPDGRPLVYGKPGFANSWFVASGALAPEPLAGLADSGEGGHVRADRERGREPR
jgi:3'(2'), 5'-bisphosphate nucleotidase